MVHDNGIQEEEQSQPPGVTGIRRRRMLSALGSASAAALAGCSGDNDTGGEADDDPGTDSSDDNDDDTDNTGGGEPVTDTFTSFIMWTVNLERIGFNDWNPTTQAPFGVSEINSTPAYQYNPAEGSYKPHAVTDWEVTSDSVSFKVSDKFAWSNGDELNAEDYWTYAQIELGMYGGETDWIDDVTLHSDREFEVSLIEPANPDIVLSAISPGHYYRDGPFSEFAERFDEAETDSEYEAIQSDLEEFTINPEEGDELPCSGTFQVEKTTESYFTCVPNDHHPERDAINFEKVEFIKSGEMSTVQGLLMSENLDNAYGRMSNTFLNGLPDMYDVEYRERFGGNSIDFQLTDDLYGIREVRQALNHILDTEEMAAAVDFEQVADQYTTGMPDSVAEAWIGDQLDSFTDYSGKNFDEAARLLREAGFEEGSDTWIKPDGEEWTVNIRAPAGDSDRVKQVEVAVSHLQEFGVNAEFNTIDVSTYWQRYRDRDWRVAVWAYGNRHNPHPYFDFTHQYRGEDLSSLPGEREPWKGTPYEIEIPFPIGDSDGSMETVQWRERIEELGGTTDEDQAVELVEELAWIYNQYTPKVPIAIETLPFMMNTRDWNLPDRDFVHTFTTTNWFIPMLENGLLQAKTK